MACQFGFWNYTNPFVTQPIVIEGGTTINYSQPLVIAQAPSDEALAEDDPAQATDVEQVAMDQFDLARDEFYAGNYDEALRLTDAAITVFPDDPTLHEFRSLVKFALGDFREAAAGLYAVLSSGPGWDWTTLSSLYPDQETYLQQLRALETYQQENPDSAEASFVLAYHYLTAGHTDEAAAQLRNFLELIPDDRVATFLLASIEPDDDANAPAFAAPRPADDEGPSISPDQLSGTWNADGPDDTKFTVVFDGKEFTWTFQQGENSQSVAGVFDVDRDTLAMEPDTGGVMLATITAPFDGRFQFQMLGAPDDDSGLEFRKVD